MNYLNIFVQTDISVCDFSKVTFPKFSKKVDSDKIHVRINKDSFIRKEEGDLMPSGKSAAALDSVPLRSR
ncbi:MAG: hypothetical protein K6C08_08320, partial [Oscillospiraceae bacterium]|nr:hypothetical protein [Oscillospiraceae bacterium]